MTDGMVQLDPATHERILALCAAGDRHAAGGHHGFALKQYADAWALIPDPKERWNLSTSVISAIADSWFLGGEYGEALRALDFAMNCPGAHSNPFLQLRLGQALLEQGEEERAEAALKRAYEAQGEAIFEHEDPKYLAFLAGRGRSGS